MFSASLLFFTFCLGAWCWRANRRLLRLETAARRDALDAMAVPQLIDEDELPALDLPRFIGSPYSGRKRSP